MANKIAVAEPKNNTTKIVAFVGIGILLLGAGVGFYFYNKSKKAKDKTKAGDGKKPVKDTSKTPTNHTPVGKQPVNHTPVGKQPKNISSYTPPAYPSYTTATQKQQQQQQQQDKQSGSIPFTSIEEGNVFRTWVNRTYPSYAKAIKLDTTGDYNNSFIQAAWDKYGTEFSNAPAPNVPYATYLQPQYTPKIPIFPADVTNAPPAPKPTIVLNPEINIPTGFKNSTEGNKFRAWVNDNYPDYAKSITLDRTGPYNNSYIKKAFAKYGNEYFNS